MIEVARNCRKNLIPREPSWPPTVSDYEAQNLTVPSWVSKIYAKHSMMKVRKEEEMMKKEIKQMKMQTKQTKQTEMTFRRMMQEKMKKKKHVLELKKHGYAEMDFKTFCHDDEEAVKMKK